MTGKAGRLRSIPWEAAGGMGRYMAGGQVTWNDGTRAGSVQTAQCPSPRQADPAAAQALTGGAVCRVSFLGASSE